MTFVDGGAAIDELGKRGALGRVARALAAGWIVLIVLEVILLFVVLRALAVVMGPELLPSAKVVLDMGALAACGWVGGRAGRPHAKTATAVIAASLMVFDLTPYVPLNVPWLVRLVVNAAGDSRYLSSLLNTALMHALLFGSLFAGAHLSRPREAPIGLGMSR